MRRFQKDIPIQVARLNPFSVSHTGKAEMNRNITDKISAKNIAIHLINHRDKIDYEEDDIFSSFKRTWTYLRLLKKQRTQLLNQLDPLMYSAHPHLQQYCREGTRQWILKLVRRYPTAKHLSRARIKGVTKIPYISQERAHELIEGAKYTTASATDDIMAKLIKSITIKILDLDKEINQQIKVLEQNCDLPEVELLKSFIGIGTYSAVGLAIEIGAKERFPTKKHLASFFGLHPKFKMSGDGVKYIGMSKKGRRVPREILFNVAKSAINTNPYIGKIYAEYVANGKNKMAAIVPTGTPDGGIIMHKILRIIYGMLKTNTPYNFEIDSSNRIKTHVMKKDLSFNDSSRRYQAFDPKAPISRRQNKRRKEREEAHNVFTLSSGLSPALGGYPPRSLKRR
ncbi:MAG: transposase [Candidatus Marinimicrobia bacterium]|nr:transposase [bacterium]MCG2716760.1 transposase [Candidatus Neomarinimicrobiota bacterium]